jgi:hypothetical protein
MAVGFGTWDFWAYSSARRCVNSGFSDGFMVLLYVLTKIHTGDAEVKD